jgi:TolB-like protein
MKKYLITLLAISFINIFCTPVFSQNMETIAFLYFDNNSLQNREELEPLTKGITDMFITEFSQIENLQVVERVQLEKLLDEMAMGQSGILEESSAQQVGKMLGAQYLVFGSFMNLYKNDFRIDVRIVQVETGLTIRAEQETGKKKEFFKMVKKLSAKIIKNLKLKVTKTDIASLARIENNSLDAAILYSRGLDYEDNGDLTNAIKMYKKALKENPKFISAKKRLKELEVSN